MHLCHHKFTSTISVIIQIYHVVIMTARDGRILHLENVFLRGAQIKFTVLPELLKSASILKKIQGLKAKRIDSSEAAATKDDRPTKKAKHVRF